MVLVSPPVQILIAYILHTLTSVSSVRTEPANQRKYILSRTQPPDLPSHRYQAPPPTPTTAVITINVLACASNPITFL